MNTVNAVTPRKKAPKRNYDDATTSNYNDVTTSNYDQAAAVSSKICKLRNTGDYSVLVNHQVPITSLKSRSINPEPSCFSL